MAQQNVNVNPFIDRLDKLTVQIRKKYEEEQATQTAAQAEFNRTGFQQYARTPPKQLGVIEALNTGAGKAAFLKQGGQTYRGQQSGLTRLVGSLGEGLSASQATTDLLAKDAQATADLNTKLANAAIMQNLDFAKPTTKLTDIVSSLGTTARVLAAQAKADAASGGVKISDLATIQKLSAPLKATDISEAVPINLGNLGATSDPPLAQSYVTANSNAKVDFDSKMTTHALLPAELQKAQVIPSRTVIVNNDKLDEPGLLNRYVTTPNVTRHVEKIVVPGNVEPLVSQALAATNDNWPQAVALMMQWLGTIPEGDPMEGALLQFLVDNEAITDQNIVAQY